VIFDNIEKLNRYLQQDLYNEILQVLNSNSISLTEYQELTNNYGFYKIIKYLPKQNDFVIESHIRYVDIQIILQGVEQINIYKSKLNILRDYNQEDDCTFYSKTDHDFDSMVVLKKGNFAIFFADDIHETQISYQGIKDSILKIVFKIDEKFLT
jgi:YhcH/YjgK/YiaL family protein